MQNRRHLHLNQKSILVKSNLQKCTQLQLFMISSQLKRSREVDSPRANKRGKNTKAVLTLLMVGFLACTTRGVGLAGVLLGAAGSALAVGALVAVTLGWAAFSLLLLGFAAPAVPRGVAFASPPAIFTCNTICASLRSHTLGAAARTYIFLTRASRK